MEDNQSSKIEVIAKGMATAVVATTIIQTGKEVISRLSKHPLAIFSLGIAAGYLTHKYRKQIISITNKTAEQTKDFVLRQTENLKDFLVETPEDTAESDALK